MADEILRKIAEKIDAAGIGEIDVDKFKNFFLGMDPSGSGSISRENWVSAFAERFNSDGELAGKFFDRIDNGSTGSISVDALRTFFQSIAAGAEKLDREQFAAAVKAKLG